MTTDFFEMLPSFTRFEEACDPKHYYPAPDDWLVVVADVQGSTKAIENGRYKEVNMVGAACITAAVNACKGVEIPYVFGGDGCTLLIPASHAQAIQTSLLALKQLSQEMHELPLRVGIVPLDEIRKRGKDVLVAKYQIHTGCKQAMFSGGGANLADELVKNGGYSLEDEVVAESDLSGLSCRWQPIRTQSGTMLTLLVRAMGEEEDLLYQEINGQIGRILENAVSSPVKPQALRYTLPNRTLLRQSQMVWKPRNPWKQLCGHIFMIAWFYVLNRFNLKVGNFDVCTYRDDMIANSDYRKFDDMLRMVIDCTMTQAEAIEAYLKALQDKKKIVYGTHYSNTALMTCFVMSTKSDGHIHFIDGNDGGYALAAKQLKAQAGS